MPLQLVKQLMSADHGIEREIDAVLQRMKKGQNVYQTCESGRRQKIGRVSVKTYVVQFSFAIVESDSIRLNPNI